MPKGDLFDPPDFLTENQRARWTYVIANAVPGLLKRLDRDLLAAWVVAVDMHAVAVAEQAKLDAANPALPLVRPSARATRDEAGNVTVTDGGNFVLSPYVAIINKQTMIMAKLAGELGFSPASRTRISLGAAPDPTPNNAFAAF